MRTLSNALRISLIVVVVTILSACAPPASPTTPEPADSTSASPPPQGFPPGGAQGGGGENPHQGTCETPAPATFTVYLPKLEYPPDEEGQGWTRPLVWQHHPDAQSDSIKIPNGRPIYALMVAGYENNSYLDELLVYNFTRHLQEQGAYVHHAWWNNLLAPYMERPLHHSQSSPGNLLGSVSSFVNVADAGTKAVPGEDYQFVADAELLLAAIRENNPSAMIVVVGHSMGGGAIVHLGARTNVVLDILAPIDPVGNRNYPWAGPLDLHGGGAVVPDYNWTRWRVTRDNFLGYKTRVLNGLECIPVGPWLKDIEETQSDLLCSLLYTYHDAPPLHFGSNVINLFHRYQQEALFPFDFLTDYAFGHAKPLGGSTSQSVVATKLLGSDPGGWPLINPFLFPCCPSGAGVGWIGDGHGEIVGYRGPFLPIPMAVRVRTSPNCGNCLNQIWPARTLSSADVWLNDGASQRKALLQALEDLPPGASWAHEPTNPDLCLVSNDLIALFEGMNRPPVAIAGEDQNHECTGPGGTEVILDGMASSDPDDDTLEFEWAWPGGFAAGSVVTVLLPLGQHCITLTVRDPSGHIARDIVVVTIADTTPPDLTVSLSPAILWPPNHRMVNIQASVAATDLCGQVATMTLVSITSSDPDNGQGDGNTTGDIAGAEMNTLDLFFQLRAEWTGGTGSRVYTVTYQATDESENRSEVTAEVTVINPNH